MMNKDCRRICAKGQHLQCTAGVEGWVRKMRDRADDGGQVVRVC